RARRGARDVRHPARDPRRLHPRRTTALTNGVLGMIGVFVAVAVLLVAFGGLLAAADAALGTLSRIDSADLAAHSRSKKSLLAIAADGGPHVTAINFMRVLSETTAAVLVTLAFAAVFTDWWWVLLAA